MTLHYWLVQKQQTDMLDFTMVSFELCEYHMSTL